MVLHGRFWRHAHRMAAINNKWYYMNSSGAMLTGWQFINHKWYYLNSSGAMLTGTQKIDGKTYTFTESGDLVE